MTLARSLRAAFVAVTFLVSAASMTGCAYLPFASGKHDPEVSSPDPAASDAAPAASARAEYRLDVQAPDALRKLLTEYLDLARFQNAPATDRIDAAELERLMRAAPSQARGLLETEGYFNAEVAAAKLAENDGGLPLIRIVVQPGPRATVASVEIQATGELQTSASTGDATAKRELMSLRDQWPLRKGDAFRQPAWVNAKNSTLARLRADGYAAAVWRETSAHVDAPQNTVDVSLVLESGPLFHLGAIRIEGLERYDEDSVRKLSTFGTGAPYSEQTLLDFQERLQKVGLFEGASVELDADASNAEAAPVVVRVKEFPLQQATLGIGYSANTGPRLSVEHTERRLFGTRWIAQNKFELGPDQQTWEGDLTSHPLDGLYRNLLSASTSRVRADDQVVLGWNTRIGRTQETQRIDRLYYAELTHARVDGSLLASQADAASLNYHWVFRNLDNVLLPTQGSSTSVQTAAGYARGRQQIADDLQEAKGPFARLYARVTWYERLGSWFGSARLEAGEVFSRSVVGIPDPILFRAGGDDSVRGYGYRTLGPTIDGVTVSGRMLMTSSVEIARPISPKYPDVWWATFIDAGNAADRWVDLKPAVGYGVGLRWRSPVGPLRADLAYGEQVRQFRVHVSVGVTF